MQKIINHMKKLSFLIFTTLVLFTFQACQSDGGCNLEGSWKVKSTDVQSPKFSASIIEMTKAEIENAKYDFTADGKVLWQSTPVALPVEGTWALDEKGDNLTLTFPDRSPDVFTITSCSANELSTTQRAPQDPAKEATLTINTVLERVQ